jgi:integrase
MGIHTRNVLTVKAIAASKCVKLRDGGGLWLVKKGNGRYWIFDYRFGGKRREIGLGPLHTVGLAEARQKAERAREQVRRGIDPLAHRAAEAIEAAKARDDVVTFGQYADAYIDDAVKAKRWRGARTEAGWRNTLTKHCASIRSKPIADIDTTDVLSVVRPLWGTKQETAERLRWRVERILDAARVEGLRSGDNPSTWKGNLEHVLHKPDGSTRGHHAALAYKDAPAFMARLRCTGTIAARALEFLILTATRSGETRGATWSEIHCDVWVVSANRMKGKREHRVPLSDRALEILKDMKAKRLNDFIFPGARDGSPLSNATFGSVIRAHEGGAATVHGFRSSFRDWAGDATDFPRELA